MKYPEQHLSLSIISAYLDGALSADHGAQVKGHLDDCHVCTELLSITIQLRAMKMNTEIEPPPKGLLEKTVKAALRKLDRSVPTFHKILPRVADSHLSSATVGMRGSMRNRHVIYADEASIVNLEIENTGQNESTRTIRGQIGFATRGTEDLTGIEVQLLREDKLVRSCITDQLGQFHMSALPIGKCQLRIEQSAQVTIVIDDVEF